jgi:hypothetical protein
VTTAGGAKFQGAADIAGYWQSILAKGNKDVAFKHGNLKQTDASQIDETGSHFRHSGGSVNYRYVPL